MSELIGPLTAEEWCSLRATGEDDDVLQCCAETSDLRDGIFGLLRMGGDKSWARPILRMMPRVSRGHDDFCLKDDRLRRLWEWAGFDKIDDLDQYIADTDRIEVRIERMTDGHA